MKNVQDGISRPRCSGELSNLISNPIREFFFKHPVVMKGNGGLVVDRREVEEIYSFLSILTFSIFHIPPEHSPFVKEYLKDFSTKIYE